MSRDTGKKPIHRPATPRKLGGAAMPLSGRKNAPKHAVATLEGGLQNTGLWCGGDVLKQASRATNRLKALSHKHLRLTSTTGAREMADLRGPDVAKRFKTSGLTARPRRRATRGAA